MRQINGTSNRILDLDLSKGTFGVIEVSPGERRKFLGGKGLGLYLLNGRMDLSCRPLDPENIIAITCGVIMGTGAPCSGRFYAVFKSPLTGIMGSSSCGGPFGMQLKTAGWDGLLIRGRAAEPTCLAVDENGAQFSPAGNLWGRDAWEVRDELRGKRTHALVIGPAGENLVCFANAVSGTRYLGRGGLGAVMGSKRLKAVVARGGACKIIPADPGGFARAKEKGNRWINRNPTSSRLFREFGTAGNAVYNLGAAIQPIHNFQAGQDERVHLISGQRMAAEHGTRHHTCRPCTIMCGHKGRFSGRDTTVPEFETVSLLGTNLGIFDPNRISEWNDLCGRLGMDTISAGGILAWVMEAAEKGIYESSLRFGSPDGVEEALGDMAHRRGQGREMCLGVRALARRYGGAEFAMHVKGLEVAAYDPRGSVGQGLSFAVANRGGCHLSAYPVSLEVQLGVLSPLSPFGKHLWVKFMEDLVCCLNSLHICQFTMFPFLLEPPLTRYTPKPILGSFMQWLPWIGTRLVDFSLYRDLWSSVTGIPISCGQFLLAGERIHVLERWMNTRMKIGQKDDTLPARFLRQAQKSDPKKRTVPLARMLSSYYRVRGYDREGVPKTQTLARLGLAKKTEAKKI